MGDSDSDGGYGGSYGSGSVGGFNSPNSGYGNSSFSGGGSSSPYGQYGLGPGTTEGFSPSTTLSNTDNLGFSPSADYSFGGNIGQNLAGFTGATSSDIGNYSLADMYSPSFTPGQYGLGLSANAPADVGMQVGNKNLTTSMTNMGETGLGITGTEKEVSGWDHPAVKFVRGLVGMTPQGALANMGINAVRGQDIGSSVIGAAVPGPMGAVLGAGYNAARSDNPGQSLGTAGMATLGGMVGGGLAGQYGAQLGSQAMGGLANAGFNATNREAASIGPYGQGSPMAAGLASGQQANAQGSMGQSQGGGGTNWGQLAGTLYQGYQANKQANQLAGNAQQTQQALQGQMSGLQNMYAPDSPYAKQLAQTLARQDAKAGRNSQYGTRAVELQARLAALAPTVANSMASLGQTSNLTNTQAQTANNNKQAVQAQILSQLIGSQKNPGYLQQGYAGLKDMYNTWNTPSQPTYQEPASSSYEWA